jgi:hypothetical protein
VNGVEPAKGVLPLSYEGLSASVGLSEDGNEADEADEGDRKGFTAKGCGGCF